MLSSSFWRWGLYLLTCKVLCQRPFFHECLQWCWAIIHCMFNACHSDPILLFSNQQRKSDIGIAACSVTQASLQTWLHLLFALQMSQCCDETITGLAGGPLATAMSTASRQSQLALTWHPHGCVRWLVSAHNMASRPWRPLICRCSWSRFSPWSYRFVACSSVSNNVKKLLVLILCCEWWSLRNRPDLHC